jgi:hypothetical protein
MKHALSPAAHGYAFAVLHRFPNNGGKGGANPLSSIFVDGANGLIGATSAGGLPAWAGTVFQIMPIL